MSLHPKAFRAQLLRWYDAHQRDLPWRGTRDPYKIWVSEIMLQQTRVVAVLPHYRAFLRRFPTVRALAQAREEQVLAVWSGLGYYRRARMLHRAARQIVERHGGRVPCTVAELRQLPGIGRYTAAAIASIAFGVPAAVVDGNVERVLSRLDGALSKHVWPRAEELLDPDRPGDYNQAVMELGAICCTPENPQCPRCPVRSGCATQGALPATRIELRRKQKLAYALTRRNGFVRLVRRASDERLMPGMWELPLHRANGAEAAMSLRHSITDTDYTVAIYDAVSRRGEWVPVERLPELPLTGLARKVLRRAGVL